MVSWLRVPKIIINDTINLFLTAVGILVTSNHNSFRVVFDKLLPNIFYVKIYYWKWPAEGTSTVPVVSAHFCSV